MVTTERPRQHQYECNGMSPEETLAAVVVKGGLKAEGLGWLLTHEAEWWLHRILGLEPEVVYAEAMRGRHDG